MQFLKRIIISTVLLFSAVTANADTTVSVPELVNNAEISLFTASNNCDFQASNADSKSAIDLSSIRVGPSVCDEDVLYGIYTDIQGNDSAMANLIGMHKIEGAYGYKLIKEGSIMLTTAYDKMRDIYIGVFAIVSVISTFMLLFHFGVNDQSFIAPHIHKPFIIIAGLVLIYVLKVLLLYAIFWSIAFANMIGFASMMHSLELMNSESETITTQDVTKISIDTNQIMGMAFEKGRSCQNVFFNAVNSVSNYSSAFWESTTNYTPTTLLADVVKYCDYEVKTNTSWTIGMDMTESASDVFNPNSLVTSYDIKKVTPYTTKNKQILGAQTVLGTVDVGSNGQDFEDQTGERMNDGNLVDQLNNANAKASEMAGDRMEGDFKNAYELIYGLFEKGESVDSTSMLKNPSLIKYNEGLQGDIKTLAKAVVDSTAKLDVLKLSSISSAPLVKGYFYSNVISVLHGHDKKGTEILNIIEGFRKNIYVSKMNEMCTKDWELNVNERKFANYYNSAPDSELYDLQRKDRNWVSPYGGGCIYPDADSKKLLIFGSSDVKDIIKFKRQQLAYKMAVELVWQNYFVGVKQALASENNLYNALIAQMIETSKLGFMGSIAIAQKQMTMYRTAEAVKGQILSSALSYSYHGANGEASNYVNQEMFNTTTSEDQKKMVKSQSEVNFPIVDLTNLRVTGIMNISPERLDDQSFMATFQLRKWAMSFVAMDPRSVKSYLGLNPDLAINDGASACIKDMATCKSRVRPPLSQAVTQMGLDWVEWAETMALAKGVTSTAVLAIDSLPTVVDKVSTGFVGQGSSSSKWSGFKIVATFVGKPLVIAIKTIDAILSVFMPLVTVMLIAGAFVAYIIPILTTFIIINGILYVIWFTAELQVLSVPIRLMKCLLLTKDEAIKEVKTIIFDIFAVVCHLPFLAFFMFLALFINDNIDLSTPAIYLLSTSDGTVIGGIMSLISVFWFLVFVILTNINNITPNTNKALSAAFSYRSDLKDDLIDRMIKGIQNPMVISAGSQIITQSNAVKENVMKNMSKVEKEQAYKEFEQMRKKGAQGTQA